MTVLEDTLRLTRSVDIQSQKLLQELLELIETLPHEQYRYPISACSKSSIGKHVRHCLDYFESFKESHIKGLINYDQRTRDIKIETQPELAMKKIKETLTWLRLNSLETSQEVNVQSISDIYLSSLPRELDFVNTHLTHHMAIIRLLLEFQGTKVSEDFGKALSTIIHEKQEDYT